MIIFKKVRCRNFFSVGNQFIETTLNTHATTLVCGENGCGKTCTTLDAICFGLYNKSYRNLNLPQIVNSVNGRECEVEVEFSIGTKEYKVRRGLAPRLFELYVNGKMLDQAAANGDMQDHLENDILHMSYRTFTQVVLLGSMSFTPFMRLKAADRKTVIEDVFDIGIFSSMYQKLKVKYTELKAEEESTNTQMLVENQKIKSLEEAAAKAAIRSGTRLEELTKKKEHHFQQQEIARHSMQTIRDRTTEAGKKIGPGITAFRKQHDKVVEMQHKLDSAKQRNDSDIQFFETHLTCPTCNQPIHADVKTTRLSDKKLKKAEMDKVSVTLQKQQQLLQIKVTELETAQREVEDYQKKLDQLNLSITHQQSLMNVLQREMDEIAATKDVSVQDLEAARISREKIQRSIDRLADTRHLYDLAAAMLSEGGAKTKIVERYLPVLNQLINQYLSRLGFMVDFHINSTFEETIRSRYRDEFSYLNFSAGERVRIDLALLFAFRAIAEKRNSISTNLVILDEIMDSSIDQSCIDDLTTIITTLSAGTNTIVISHRDLNADKFSRVIRIQRDGNFTQLKQES